MDKYMLVSSEVMLSNLRDKDWTYTDFSSD